MQRLITFGLASYSFFLIKTNIPRLPARIPTHFNAALSPRPRIGAWWQLGLSLLGVVVNIIYYSRRIAAVAREAGARA
jgi:hypothetical protein